MNYAISADRLSFAYPPAEDQPAAPVFEGISLQIEEGSFVAVLGHNGCGKSTLAKQCNAVLLPSGGSMTVYGMDTRQEALLYEIRRTVGMVFQNPDNQLVATIVEEDVAFGPENLGVPTKEIRARVDEALALVGMSEYAKSAPHMLSGGQKQRVAIAGVLAMMPRCIIFDEATAMLDPGGRAEVMNILEKLNREKGITVLNITHHMDEAVRADRIYVMNEGSVILEGTPEEVFRDVEKLRGVALEAPVSTETLFELNKLGGAYPLPTLDFEQCAELISKKYKEKN